jgi:phospholipase D1/2
VVDTTTIENRIGDALVQRIIRAHKEGTKWMACVVIPLLPGYTHPIDTAEASSVRLILECQNRTICRGTHSIYTRLRKEGINPDDYITFFSLRGWAKFKSGALTTEQVYIHGKTMIVDDRLVLCGSANINERSQRGDRDSELLAIVRDTDMIDGTMGGKPFKVGRYAHTLRMRLMREHVGVDVDAIEEDELMLRKPLAEASEVALWDPDNEQSESQSRGISRVKKTGASGRLNHTVASALESVVRGVGENIKREAGEVIDKVAHPIDHMEGKVNLTGPTGPERQDIGPNGELVAGFASSVVPTLEERAINEDPQTAREAVYSHGGIDDEIPPEATVTRESEEHERHGWGKPAEPEQEKFGVPAGAPEGDGPPQRETEQLLPVEDSHDTQTARKILRRNLAAKSGPSGTWTMPTPTPKIDPNRFHDPLDEHFWKDIWVASAVHNVRN